MGNIIHSNIQKGNEFRKYFNHLVRIRKNISNSECDYRQIGRTKYYKFVNRFSPILTSGMVVRRLRVSVVKNNSANSGIIRQDTQYWKY